MFERGIWEELKREAEEARRRVIELAIKGRETFRVSRVDHETRTVTFVSERTGAVIPAAIRDLCDWPVIGDTFTIESAQDLPIVNDPILRGIAP